MNVRDPLALPAAAPLRILMVEDDPNDAELIQAYLEEARRAGAEVRHVRTLAEAIERAPEAQVTLLDLDLPDSSGLATLERMREATAGPLVVISGNGHPALVQEALRRRAYDVIPKHQLDAETLRRVLRLAAQHEDASRAQRASEGRYRALVESSSEALVLLDGKGRVEYTSAAMRRVLGLEADEVQGRYGVEFVQPEDRGAVQSAFRELRAKPGARATLRVRFRHKDGGERVLESTLTNRLGEPDVAAVVCSYRDLTQEEEHRARFVATFESSAVGLAHVDPDGRILIANRRLCDLLGYSREELVGRTVGELSHPEDIDATAEQRAQLRAGELPQFTARKRYLRKDGETVWVQLTVSLERDAEGRPKYDIACFEDISEAMRRELAAQRLRHMYAALSATNEATLKTQDTQTLYRRVCELLVEHAGLKLAAVRLVDPATQWIETVAYAGEAESYLRGARISIDRQQPELQGPTVQTIVEGRTVVSNDYLAEPALRRRHASARAAGIAAMMSVPLRSGGRAIGLLALYAAERGWFDPELVALAERMAENVSFALDNLAREAARRASEERFRALTQMSSDFYWETDESHRFRLRGSGTRPSSQSTFADDAWIGKTRWELPCLSPDANGWREHRAALEARRPVRDFVFSRPCPEVGERFIMVSGDPVYDETGAFQGYRGIGTDITEQRIAQKVLELEHAVAAYLATTESESDGVLGVMRTMCAMFGWQEGRFWRVDERAGLLRFGARWHAAEGRGHMIAGEDGATLRPGEGLAGHVWQSGEPAWIQDVAADPRTSESALAGGVLRSAFLFPLHVEGRTLGVLTFAGDGQRPPNQRLRRAAGVIGGQIGLFLQRRRSEAALRDSEARFRSLTELSADWYWEQDAELKFVSTGGQDRARGGITSDQHEGLQRWELPGTEPLDGGWDEHKALLAARKPFRDFMLRRKGNDGSVHYVSVSGEPVFGEDGAFRGYRGVAKDVTDRVRDEDRLRMSHERFEIVSRATNDVVWDWNLETDQVWWNENFRHLYGYQAEEIGSRSDSWTSRIHLEDLARVKAEVGSAIERGAKSWSGEYRFRRKDGSYADVYDRGMLIHDKQGRAVRMIGAMMDISERKRAESRMFAHAQRQEAVATFGQFALGRRNPEELYAAAAQALRCAGADASVALEMVGDSGEYVIRAAQGEGPHALVGQRGKLSPDSVWPDIQRENTSRIAGRTYLSTRPAELPWGAWVRTMGSAVYSPVREGERPVGMLCVYSAAEHALGAEDARFVDSVSHVLSTALQRHKAEQRLAHLAQFDALTGLPNRTLLHDRLDQTIVQSRRKRWHAGVLFVDLDHFKLINDSLGHHQGDALIREVGQRLLSSVRPGDTVGRISGDEFAVVLADLARPDDAALVAQKVLDALGQPFDLSGNEAYVTASIGIAAFPEDGEEAEMLIKNADMAMYRAKESARNSYCFFTAEMNQRTVAKVQLSADLRRAIERQEFALHYQPKIALETGELRGLEALLRWNHPTRGMVSPVEFVPALEDSGLILPVGEWVIAEACAQIRQWELAGLAPVPIAVNLSAKQFMRRDLDRTITHVLAAAGVPPRLLELEITESCLMHNPEEAIRVLNALRDAGLKISVDDFGTGYSSLAYLARFPLSALKIDRAFVRNVHSDASASAIVRAVIDMANNLELQVIAEGVETEQQAAFLRGHGCHQGQGYLFGRPVPADVVGARLHTAR